LTTRATPAARAALAKERPGDRAITTSPSAFVPAFCRALIACVTRAWAASFSFLFGIRPGCCRPNEEPWILAMVITRTRLPCASSTVRLIATSLKGLPVEASRTPADGSAALGLARRQGRTELGEAPRSVPNIMILLPRVLERLPLPQPERWRPALGRPGERA